MLHCLFHVLLFEDVANLECWKVVVVHFAICHERPCQPTYCCSVSGNWLDLREVLVRLVGLFRWLKSFGRTELLQKNPEPVGVPVDVELFQDDSECDNGDIL